MVLDNATVHFANGDMMQGRVLFKDGGYIGINEGNGWKYYPPHRIQEVASHQGQ